MSNPPVLKAIRMERLRVWGILSRVRLVVEYQDGRTQQVGVFPTVGLALQVALSVRDMPADHFLGTPMVFPNAETPILALDGCMVPKHDRAAAIARWAGPGVPLERV